MRTCPCWPTGRARHGARKRRSPRWGTGSITRRSIVVWESGLDAAHPAIWIVHAPGFVDGVPREGFPAPAAILAGHTHGGQIRLPFYAPYTPWGSGRFVEGWYRDTLAPLYVSRGIGTVTIPARLFCLPEVAVFTLSSAVGPSTAHPGR